MKKKPLLHTFVYGNKIVAICVVFTLATLLDAVLCTFKGIADISYWHLGLRFLLCVLAILSLYLFRFFEALPLYAVIGLHFFLGLALMLGSVWVTSLFVEVHPNAYRDAARTVALLYPVLIAGSIGIDAVRTAKANRILQRRARKPGGGG